MTEQELQEKLAPLVAEACGHGAACKRPAWDCIESPSAVPRQAAGQWHELYCEPRPLADLVQAAETYLEENAAAYEYCVFQSARWGWEARIYTNASDGRRISGWGSAEDCSTRLLARADVCRVALPALAEVHHD